MAVTGKIKFFERSKTLLSDNDFEITVMATDKVVENESAKNILSFDRSGYYIGQGLRQGISQDSDKIKISFKQPIKVSRYLFVDTNLKQIRLQFKNGGRTVNFKNVVDIDNNITIGPFSDSAQHIPLDGASNLRNVPIIEHNVFYAEFDEAEIDEVLISMFYSGQSYAIGSVFVPYLRQFILTNEIGTFEGFPNISSYSENQNEIINMTSTGLKHITKQHNTVDSFRIAFKSHPIENDIAIADRLYNSMDSFTLWPCGGGYGSNHFLFEKEGWKLDDIYNVQTTGKKSNRWHKNFYKGGISSTINLVESL